MADNKGIPPGKKRYTLTLTVKNMEAIQALLKEKNIPKSLLSATIDDFLASLFQTLRELESIQQRTGGEPLGFGDLLTVVGNAMSETTNKQGKLI
jgi:hypothetical protein